MGRRTRADWPLHPVSGANLAMVREAGLMNDDLLPMVEPAVCPTCGEDEGDSHDQLIHALEAQALTLWDLFSIWFLNWRIRPVWRWWR